MAQFVINTTPEERAKVIKALEHFKDKTVAVSAIASKASLNPNRVRYILVDLLDMDKIKRIPTKAFNKHYIRYKYEIMKG